MVLGTGARYASTRWLRARRESTIRATQPPTERAHPEPSTPSVHRWRQALSVVSGVVRGGPHEELRVRPAPEACLANAVSYLGEDHQLRVSVASGEAACLQHCAQTACLQRHVACV